jgi:hypothetical protein
MENFWNGLGKNSLACELQHCLVAKKSNLLKQAEPIGNGFQIQNRHAMLSAALYLIQLREQPLKISMPKQARKIEVEAQTEVFRFVKIIHAG